MPHTETSMSDTNGKRACHILLVDDEALITDLMSSRLGALGIEVTVSRNGLEALDAIARRRPDLVISDVRMPYMDGVELSRLLASDPETSAIPIILLTAAPGDHTGSGAPNIRATVRKPFAVDEIVTRSVGLLKRQSA